MDFIGSRWSLAAQHERGTRCFLRGDLDVDVRGTSLRQALAHDAMREFGTVAVAAEVAEVKMLKLGGDDLDCDFGGGFVGKMAVPADDALLDAPRTLRVVLKQLEVVIRFEHQGACAANALNDQLRRVTEVGEKADVPARRAQEKANGIAGIMRHAEGIDAHASHLEGRARAEETELEARSLELLLDGFLGQAVAVDGDVQLRGEHAESLDVVGMFVRDENSAQVFRCPSDPQQSLTDLAGAQTSVDEQTNAVALEMGAVAAGTAGENGKPGRHAGTLETSRVLGKWNVRSKT